MEVGLKCRPRSFVGHRLSYSVKCREQVSVALGKFEAAQSMANARQSAVQQRGRKRDGDVRRGTNGQVLQVSAQIRNRLVVDALSIKLKKCYQGTLSLLPPSRFLLLVL